MNEWGEIDVKQLCALVLVAVIDYLISYINSDALSPGLEANRESTLGERGH